MPVPVSITNPNGLGLQAATAQALPTEGPFERMARLKAQAAVATHPEIGFPHTTQPQPASPATAPDAATAGTGNGHDAVQQPAVELCDLTFSYPGLGVCMPDLSFPCRHMAVSTC